MLDQMLDQPTDDGNAFLEVMRCGSHTYLFLPDDPIDAENEAIRILAMTTTIREMERMPYIPRLTTDPGAFGLSDLFRYWELRGASVGVIWYLSPDMEFIVGH